VPTLREIVLTDEKKEQVFRECVDLLDGEVRRKRGVSGFAVKAGYKIAKTIKPGFVPKVLRDLVPEFCDALEPLHERHLSEKKGTFGDYMNQHLDEVVEALLSVTDGKAEKSKNKRVRKAYLKLRGSAEHHVREAVPGLARLLNRHYALAEDG
jgi:hypothetical protein